MLCLYLVILGIWKGIAYARNRKRSGDELNDNRVKDTVIENKNEKEKKKTCTSKNVIICLLQIILVFGSMTFLMYMINEKTEHYCSTLEIPEKWRCQFNYFFNTNNEEKQNHFNCPAITNNTFDQNLAVVQGYASNFTDEILLKLEIDKIEPSPLLHVFENMTPIRDEQNFTVGGNQSSDTRKHHLQRLVDNEFQNFLYIVHKIGTSFRIKKQSDVFDISPAPAIVTAMSNSNIREGIAFVKNVIDKIFPLQDVTKLVIFDFGLSHKHVVHLQKNCTFCEVRHFPFSKFSNLTIHYALKPLMIELALNEFGTIIWADPNIRFHPVYLRDLVTSANYYGIQIAKNTEMVRITRQNVRHEIIKYLKEETCMEGFHEIQSKFIVFSKKTSIFDIVLPWIRASIGYGYLTKQNLNIQTLPCLYNPVEETILDIIINRLYIKNMSNIVMDINEYVYTEKNKF